MTRALAGREVADLQAWVRGLPVLSAGVGLMADQAL
jgi:hypothetical protein